MFRVLRLFGAIILFLIAFGLALRGGAMFEVRQGILSGIAKANEAPSLQEEVKPMVKKRLRFEDSQQSSKAAAKATATPTQVLREINNTAAVPSVTSTAVGPEVTLVTPTPFGIEAAQEKPKEEKKTSPPVLLRIPKRILVPVKEIGRVKGAVEVPNVRPSDNQRQFGIWQGTVGFFNETSRPGSGDGFYVGHYATLNHIYGEPFFLLPEVGYGEKVEITNEEGQKFIYEVFVRVQVKVSDKKLPLTYSNPKMFIQELYKELNKKEKVPEEDLVVLLTCIGDFNTAEGQYSDRLVVIAKRVT